MKSITTCCLIIASAIAAFLLLPSHGGEDRKASIAPIRSVLRKHETMKKFRDQISKNPDGVMSSLENDSWDGREATRDRLARMLAKDLVDRDDETRLTKWLSHREVATASYAPGAAKEAAAAIAMRSIDGALEFSGTIPRGTMSRDLALQETFRAWARTDWEQAYAWLDSRPTRVVATAEGIVPEEESPAFDGGDGDSALAGYILGIFEISAETASENLPLIRDPGLRERVRRELLEVAGVK